MPMQKQFDAEFKALGAEDGGKPGDFEAIVAVYDNVDRQGDRIKAGAFDETLEAWRKSGDPIPIVLAHGWDDPFKHIGYAQPDQVKSIPGRGLYAKGHLDVDDNPLAKQVHRLMERRTLKEFSFGYRIPDGGEQKASDGAYDLLKLDLIEFGPCLKGVNEETELLAIKSELESERRREAGEEPTLEERLAKAEAAIAELQDGGEPEGKEDEPEGKGDESEAGESEGEDEDTRAEEDQDVKSADLDLELYRSAVDNQEHALKQVLDFDEDLDAAQRTLDSVDL